ncbi:hypothetical protein MTR67_033426 [Solanum verrucosum]|uniref:Amino acid transporter transmembrane domain-containing protein n=1 Tax=Solanum verrucosum TaxID=315347 RepID=A0AAF0U6D0_SOLVR|nr:hypothetical protein MTR67_033426 [Solanum verrucosum]
MEAQRSLEQEKTSGKEDEDTIRTGTLWTAVAHIISAVIGAGVLSLAWCTAQLGWIAGPITMLCFAVVTYISASLICDCYRSPDPITGTRNPSYIDAVRVNLGRLFHPTT